MTIGETAIAMVLDGPFVLALRLAYGARRGAVARFDERMARGITQNRRPQR